MKGIHCDHEPTVIPLSVLQSNMTPNDTRTAADAHTVTVHPQNRPISHSMVETKAELSGINIGLSLLVSISAF